MNTLLWVLLCSLPICAVAQSPRYDAGALHPTPIHACIEASVAKAAATEQVIELRLILSQSNDPAEREQASKALYLIYEAAVRRGSAEGLRKMQQGRDEANKAVFERAARRQELEYLARILKSLQP